MAAVCVPVYHPNTTNLPKFLLLKILWTQLDLVHPSNRVVAAVVELEVEVPPNPPTSRPHSPRTRPSPSRSSLGWKSHVRTPSKKTAPPAQAQLMVCVPTAPYPFNDYSFSNPTCSWDRCWPAYRCYVNVALAWLEEDSEILIITQMFCYINVKIISMPKGCYNVDNYKCYVLGPAVHRLRKMLV